MANTITISVSPQDLAFLKENPSISPSKLFRSAIRLEKVKNEFVDIYDISDYCLSLRERGETFLILSKEIQRGNERIESLQDVLAQKELNERRIREVKQTDHGLVATNPTA